MSLAALGVRTALFLWIGKDFLLEQGFLVAELKTFETHSFLPKLYSEQSERYAIASCLTAGNGMVQLPRKSSGTKTILSVVTNWVRVCVHNKSPNRCLGCKQF